MLLLFLLGNYSFLLSSLSFVPFSIKPFSVRRSAYLVFSLLLNQMAYKLYAFHYALNSLNWVHFHCFIALGRYDEWWASYFSIYYTNCDKNNLATFFLKIITTKTIIIIIVSRLQQLTGGYCYFWIIDSYSELSQWSIWKPQKMKWHIRNSNENGKHSNLNSKLIRPEYYPISAHVTSQWISIYCSKFLTFSSTKPKLKQNKWQKKNQNMNEWANALGHQLADRWS